MPTNLDIANRSLQRIGTRVNMSQTEFNAQTSNEAIQLQLTMFAVRDELNRMAPWNCALKFTNLVYITSQPTTPENPGPGLPFWQAGVPIVPWLYEYQYPVDCLRARYVMPQYTAQAGGVPVYPPGTTTGSQQVGWAGPALKFTIATDSFVGVSAATVNAAGTGYAVNDIITLAQPTFTVTQNLSAGALVATPSTVTMSVGAPAQLTVTGIGGGGAITTVTPVNQVLGETSSPSGGTPITPIAGSYFSSVGALSTQGSTTGAGTGATFNLTFTTAAPQRVLLCNQENAILCYNTQITDPNLMDPQFQQAWISALAGRLAYQLSGDKQLANQCLQEANGFITEARKGDGNEDLTVNDVTPDFLRIRGNWGGPSWEFSPNSSTDWGTFFSPY